MRKRPKPIEDIKAKKEQTLTPNMVLEILEGQIHNIDMVISVYIKKDGTVHLAYSHGGELKALGLLSAGADTINKHMGSGDE